MGRMSAIHAEAEAVADQPPPEEWRTVSAAPDYAVSNFGRVKRQVAGRTRRAQTFLAPCERRADGYLCVHLRFANERRARTVFVHRLVCEAFAGPPPTPIHQVAHYDGDRLNNAADNLRWATARENADDKRRHGRILSGDRHPTKTGLQRIPRGEEHWSRSKPELICHGENIGTSKLTAEQVREIKAEPQYLGITVALAKQYDVSNALIGRIRRGLQWRRV